VNTHGEKVVVQQQLSKLETEGGIALPETSQQKLPIGTVVCVGEKVTVVQPGNRVQFNGYAGASVTVKNQDYLVLDQEDILIVLENGDE
jgi:chaperonin GroES